MNNIPTVDGAIIGGSGTWGARFPEDFPNLELKVIDYIPEVETPFGLSAPFKLLGYRSKKILYVGMHGCFPNDTEVIHPYRASKQVAWVFKQAKAPWVITGGSVGGIQTLTKTPLCPGSILIPSDFVMYPSVVVVPTERIPRPSKSFFFRLAQPFCPILSEVLRQQAEIYERQGLLEKNGVYVCSPWGRFETQAEIEMMKQLGWHIVGQTVGHEAIALRDAGIPVGSLNVVSNFAEPGPGQEWIGVGAGAMAEFYQQCPTNITPIIAYSVMQILDQGVKPSSLEPFMLTGLEKFPVAGA